MLLPKKARFLSMLMSFLVPGLFFLYMFHFSHFDQAFEYDPDEGLCLMRAFMHSEGFAFYKDIWMDVPPLMDFLISGIIKVFGPSIFHARLMVLFFSTALLWGMFQIVKRTQDALSAAFAVLLIIFTSYYAQLSVSVMIGLPAVAWAVLSVWAVLLYRDSFKRRYLLLAGIFLGLGLLSKFFVIVYLPAIMAAVLMAEKKQSGVAYRLSRSVQSMLYLALPLLGVYFYFSFVTNQLTFSRLSHSYLAGNRIGNYPPGYTHIKEWIFEEFDVALLALSALICFRSIPRKMFLMPAMILFMSGLVLWIHTPVWYHHRLLVFVPMCWLASYSFHALCQNIFLSGWAKKRLVLKIEHGAMFLLIGALVIVAVVRFPYKYRRMRTQIVSPASEEERQVLRIIKRYKGQTHLFVTDRPIFAFYADLPVPPYLASLSWKRVHTGLIKYEEVVSIIAHERPELILFSRFDPLGDKCVLENYRLAYQNEGGTTILFVSKTLMDIGSL